MKMYKKINALFGFLIATALMGVLAYANDAMAVSDSVKIKAAYEGVYQCFKAEDAYSGVFLASSGGAGMINKGGNSSFKEMVKLPYGLTDAGDNNANCKEILKGWSDNASKSDLLNQGLMPDDIWDSADIVKVKNYFASIEGDGGTNSMGYKAIASGNVSSGQTTYRLEITLDKDRLGEDGCQRPSSINTNTIGPGIQSFYTNPGGGGQFDKLVFPTITKDSTGNWWFGDAAANSNGANVPMPGSYDSVMYYFCNDDSYIQITDQGTQASPYYIIHVYYSTYLADPDNSERIKAYGFDYGYPSEMVTGSSSGYDYTANTRLFKGNTVTGTVQDSSDFDDYSLEWASGSYMNPIKKLSTTNTIGYRLAAADNYSDLALTDQEIFDLYSYYIGDKNVYNMPVVCEGEPDFATYTDANSSIINWTYGKTCRVYTASPSQNYPSNVYGVDYDKSSSTFRHFVKKVSINDIINTMNALPNSDEIAANEAELQCKTQIEQVRSVQQMLIDSGEAWSFSSKPEARKIIENITNALAASGGKYSEQKEDGAYGCIDIEGVTTDVSISPDNGYTESGTIVADPESSINQVPDSCGSLGAAGSLGWIVCPILDLAGSAAQWAYDEIVDPFLSVEPGLVDTSTGTYIGWQIFQNIANTLAIFLLLVVIFSQVTGIGIDNYGIKKVLPKIIVAMVLINLSFFICQAAVDISNIAGKGLKDMFDSLGGNVVLTKIADQDLSSIRTSTGIGVTFGTIGIVGALIGLLVAFPGIAIMALPGILMAIVGAVLGALVAILMLFVLLTVRKIAIIVLIVLSPIAVVCYMLPNTKKIFDKWLSFLKNMLLIYPICGIVIGGGNFVSKVILTSQGDNPSFALALTAMLAGVVPFFFVPKLLKGSMNVLGNIGAKLSNFGKGIGGKAKTAVGNSDRMKDIQKRATMARNQSIYNKLKARQDSGKKLSSFQSRRMNNARLAYNNAAREDIAAAAGGAILAQGSTAYGAAMSAQESAANKQELDNQIIAMANDTKNYDADVMADKLEKLLSRTTALGHDDEVMMKALMQQLTTKGGYGKKLLAKTVRGASGATRAQAAKFMSKNGDVAAAMNKNMAVAQYLRDVNADPSGTPESFDKWFTDGTHTMADGTKVSNSSFVLSSVITDDSDFVAQSAGTVEMMLNAKEKSGEYSLSGDRLRAMVSNERLMDSADSDVRNAIVAAAKARGLSEAIPPRYSGAPTTPAPSVTTVAPSGRTTTVTHPDGTTTLDSSTTVTVPHDKPAATSPTEEALAKLGLEYAPDGPSGDAKIAAAAEAARRRAEEERNKHGGLIV